jgi:hypothetical protein
MVDYKKDGLYLCIRNVPLKLSQIREHRLDAMGKINQYSESDDSSSQIKDETLPELNTNSLRSICTYVKSCFKVTDPAENLSHPSMSIGKKICTTVIRTAGIHRWNIGDR